MEIPDNCNMCGRANGTSAHLFLECDFSQKVWAKVNEGIASPICSMLLESMTFTI